MDEALRALGYTPNPAARSLLTRRTDSVALVVPEPDERVFSDPFFARTLRGVSRVLTERDLQLVLLMARPGPEEQRMLRYPRNPHVDGALVVSDHEGPTPRRPPRRRSTSRARSSGARGRQRRPGSYVDTDNVAGSRLADPGAGRPWLRRIGAIAARPT